MGVPELSCRSLQCEGRLIAADGPADGGGFLFLSALLHTQNDHFTGQNCCEGKTISKNSISVDARGMASFLGFRSVMPMSSDLSYGVASRRYRSRKSVGSSGRHTS